MPAVSAAIPKSTSLKHSSLCRHNPLSERVNLFRHHLQTLQIMVTCTGSSSGIGRITAIAIAKEGIKVLIAARRDKEGEETLRLVKESDGDKIDLGIVGAELYF